MSQLFNSITSSYLHLCKSEIYKKRCREEKINALLHSFVNYHSMMVQENRINNSIFVEHLKQKFLEIFSIIHDQKISEFLLDFLRLLQPKFTHEIDQIYNYLNVFEFKNGKNNILLKGDIQSGKTLMTVLASMCYLINNRNVIIFLRNSRSDVDQFISRFRQVQSTLKELNYNNDNLMVQNLKSSRKIKGVCCFVTNYHKTYKEKLLHMIII